MNIPEAQLHLYNSAHLNVPLGPLLADPRLDREVASPAEISPNEEGKPLLTFKRHWVGKALDHIWISFRTLFPEFIGCSYIPWPAKSIPGHLQDVLINIKA